MAEENTLFSGADNIYFEPVENEDGLSINADAQIKSNLAGLIEARYAEAQMARDSDENRWITAYHNFRGMYAKNVRFRESEKSRVFIKVTKTKVLAAFGQLVDVIFGTGKFPIGVVSTPLPEGVSEYMHLSSEQTPGIETSAATPSPTSEKDPMDIGFKGDGKVLKPGATINSGKGIFEDLEEKLSFEEGPSPIPAAPEISPAKEAARNMERLIHDQIDESNGSTELRNAIFESTLFGTGIVKGPFNFNKTLHKWENGEDNERTYSPKTVRVPRIEFVSVWDFFPDPNATSIEECEFVVHRHKLNKSQLRGLRKMPYFNEEAIRECMMIALGRGCRSNH